MTAARRSRVELLAYDPDNLFKSLDLSKAQQLGEVERCILKILPDTHIIGIDEAGRGPLAGPVIAAAVYIAPGFDPPPLLDDSKKLSHPQREQLFDTLVESLDAWAICGATNCEIDELNIRQASILAMSRALQSLHHQVHMLPATPVLVDGDLHLPTQQPQVALVKGDGRSLAIAAASILAKVWRDRIMVELDAAYPGYGMAGHKGYPTGAHRNAVLALGHSPVHRRSFTVRPAATKS